MGGVAVGGRELWHGAAWGLAQGMGGFDGLGWAFGFGFGFGFCFCFGLRLLLLVIPANAGIQGLSCENV
ncbi:hypothetical protein ASD86_05420 [Lysobacter sp. Root690]|nr:hypothetical protein ASD86_05420 [Lysobacter sp. Root690]